METRKLHWAVQSFRLKIKLKIKLKTKLEINDDGQFIARSKLLKNKSFTQFNEFNIASKKFAWLKQIKNT